MENDADLGVVQVVFVAVEDHFNEESSKVVAAFHVIHIFGSGCAHSTKYTAWSRHNKMLQGVDNFFIKICYQKNTQKTSING